MDAMSMAMSPIVAPVTPKVNVMTPSICLGLLKVPHQPSGYPTSYGSWCLAGSSYTGIATGKAGSAKFAPKTRGPESVDDTTNQVLSTLDNRPGVFNDLDAQLEAAPVKVSKY